MKVGETMQKAIQDNVLLDYLQNSFTAEDIKEFEGISEKHGFSLATNAHRALFLNGPENWFPQIALVLSPAVVQTILYGLATNAIYDGLKALLTVIRIRLKANMKAQPFYSLSSNGKIEEVTPQVHIVVGQSQIDIPVEMEQDKFEYCIDKAMEVVKELEGRGKTYCVWDEEKGAFRLYTYEESLRTEFAKEKEHPKE